MNYLSEEDLKEYSHEELINLRKWLDNYIVSFNKDKITWQILSYDELKKFFDDNYYDEDAKEYVSWFDSGSKMPIGMYFLSFPKRDRGNKYFVGTIRNSINKQTIIASICYLDKCKIFDDCDLVTSVEGIEINYFYRGLGLLKEIIGEFVKNIPSNQNIIVTAETPLGKKHQVMKHLKEALNKNGFVKDVRFEDEINDAYLEKITRK